MRSSRTRAEWRALPGGIVPEEVAAGNGIERTPSWRADLVKQVALSLCKSLTERKSLVAKRPSDESAEGGLLAELIGAGYLPTFGFPVDLCGFVVATSIAGGESAGAAGLATDTR